MYPIVTIAMIVFFALVGLVDIFVVAPSHTIVIVEGVAALVIAVALFLKK